MSGTEFRADNVRFAAEKRAHSVRATAHEARAAADELIKAMMGGDAAAVEMLIRSCPDPAAFVQWTAIPVDSEWNDPFGPRRPHGGQCVGGMAIAVALGFERPDWAEMMFDAGAEDALGYYPDINPLRAAVGGWTYMMGQNVCCGRPPPPARPAERLVVFRRLLTAYARASRGYYFEQTQFCRGDLCKEIIDAGESAAGFLAGLLAVWSEPDAESSTDGYTSLLIPYREYARATGQGPVVDWVGTGGCRVAWIREVVRATLAAPRR